jgi:uncharacterized phage protein gp47/JayE
VVDFGLQASGFVIKDLDTILTEIEDDQRAAFGADFDVSPSSPEGIANGIIAAKLAEAWQQLGAVYNSEYPNGAEDTSLDQLCQLTGVRRLPATRSAVTAGITGTPGTVLTDGFDNTRIKNSGTKAYGTWRWAPPRAPRSSSRRPRALRPRSRRGISARLQAWLVRSAS